MNVIENLKENINFSECKLSSLRFDKKNMYHLASVGIYLSIVELSESIYILTKNSSFVGVPPIIRTVMEAYVDLINLSNDPSYTARLDAADTEQWLKLLKEARKGTNPYCASLSQMASLEGDIREREQKLAEYRNKKLGPLSVAESFIKAGMEEEYRTLYNEFSTHGHNNFRSITARHIEFVKDKSDYSLIYKKSADGVDYDHVVTTTTNFLVRSGILVHKIFKTGDMEMFEGKLAEFEKREAEHFTKYNGK